MKDQSAALKAVASDARTGTRGAVLLAGAAGAAGARAAETLAAELGTTVSRVDLGAVVSKYIGETEKHLDAVFAEAERAGAVLLLDEADALFGKRTAVEDSQDRSANLDTGDLLARVEEYNGVVLLATNLRTNIDPAFTRRLRVIDYTAR
ncbi:MAG TPA: ATP-binding protein [Vicinamibacterales bacterium]|nr:ATP-binding protein [Vicinamibacterales bacterium]